MTDVHINQTQLGMDIFANVIKDTLKLKDNVDQTLKYLVQIYLHLVQWEVILMLTLKNV